MRLLGILCSLLLAGVVLSEEVVEPAVDPQQKDLPAEKPPKASAVRDYEVTITAKRSSKAEDVFRTPATVDVLTEDYITHRRNAPSLVDALDETPGVMVQKTAPGQGSPLIRGFTGYQTLLLIDGVRFNNSTFRSGPNEYWRTVDPLSVQRLEVVKGPFSALYGSDAVGGTVNAVTKDPSWGDGTHAWQGIDWGGWSYYRGASGERSNIGHVELEGSHNKKVAFLFTGSYKDFDDLKAGGDAGVQQNTGFSEFGGDGKIVYRIDDQNELTFLGQHFRQQAVPRTEQTVFAQPFHGTTVGTEFRRDTDQFRSLAYFEYHGKELNSILDDVVVNLNYQNHQEERDRKTSNGRTDTSGFDVDTFGLFAQLQTKTPGGTLIYGLDYYHDNVDSFRRNFNADGTPRSNGIQGPLGDNASYDLFGAFIQDDIWLFNERLNLVAGLRYSHAAAEAAQVEDPVTGDAFSISDSWNSVVGNLRALVFVDEAKRWNFYGGVSQAFRAPSLSDLTTFDATSAVETPTPGLKPEEYLQFEAGVKGKHDALRFNAAYFYTLINSQITQSPTGALINNTPEVVKTNDGKGWLQGVEASVEYTFFRRWTPWANFTWQEGETDQLVFATGEKTRAPLTRLMPLTGHLGLRYRPAAGKWWVEAVGTFVGRQDKLALRDRVDIRRIPPGGTPGYSLLAIRGSAEIHKNLFISGGVENITNQNYRVHGSGTNSPGINAFVSIDYRW
jgi:hemoglobin/transferrin/lactoferrin receptor protein